jgi:hypothetical protein
MIRDRLNERGVFGPLSPEAEAAEFEQSSDDDFG